MDFLHFLAFFDPANGLDCARWSREMEFLKIVGPTLGIAGAILAWLANKWLSWTVWICERFLTRYELMHALRAEIQSNSQGESFYYPGKLKSDEMVPQAEKLISDLRSQLGPYKSLTPYIPPVSGNPVYESARSSLSHLSRWIVWPIVRYYSASVQLTNQLADFRSESYRALGQTRQSNVIRQLWQNIGREVEISANQARRRLAIWIRFYDLIFVLVIALFATTLTWMITHERGLRTYLTEIVTPVVERVQSCSVSFSNASP